MSVDARATNEKRPTKPRLQGIFAHTQKSIVFTSVVTFVCRMDRAKTRKAFGHRWDHLGKMYAGSVESTWTELKSFSNPCWG